MANKAVSGMMMVMAAAFCSLETEAHVNTVQFASFVCVSAVAPRESTNGACAPWPMVMHRWIDGGTKRKKDEQRSSCIRNVVIFAMFGLLQRLLLFGPWILHLIPFLHLLLGSFVGYTRDGPSHQRLFANAVAAAFPVWRVFICHHTVVFRASSYFIVAPHL